MLPQDSYLNNIQTASAINVASGNFSSVQGLAHLTITPNAYIVNGTLTIITDDPQATIKLYSDIPLTLVSGGTGNATYILPIIKDQMSMDIIFTFSNASIQHQVKFEVTMDTQNPLSNSTIVYANP